jgi:eukaryotic-like serine/threonine-protein kinase
MSATGDATTGSGAVHMLAGTDLGNGWKIGDLVVPGAYASGGCFSCGYVVENLAGERAFLKAFDFSHGLEDAPDPVETLNAMTSAFLFERELLNRCKQKHLKRVVTVIAAGRIKTPNAPGGAIYYLVFERANGDVRAVIDAESRFDMAWRLRTLHHIAAAVKQLHGINIAHQDIKPSNVLFFPAEGSKVGDLGRAACPGLMAPHEDDAVPGDPDYAPPELLYGDYGDWRVRHLGCDLYLLGSMIVFFCTNLVRHHPSVAQTP